MNANAQLYVPVYIDSYVEKIEWDFRAARVMAVRTAYLLSVEALFLGVSFRNIIHLNFSTVGLNSVWSLSVCPRPFDMIDL